ncbi:hypothetical protein V9T40_013024 [Parthenolecanium corni]|uniref:guanylate cyclase n=1 Tax=Parthenolecanium corni TaxID=536013 RepID=A0AAN9Y144_9HEMI
MKKLSYAGRHKVWEVVVFEFISGSGGAVNLERDKWHKTLKSPTSVFICNIIDRECSNVHRQSSDDEPSTNAQCEQGLQYLELLFTTDRVCLAGLLVGVLKAIAKRFYQTDVTIRLTSCEEKYSFRYSIVARENSLSPSEDNLVNRVDVNHSLENGSEVISDLVTDLKRLRTKVVAPQLSTNVSDLKISVSSFCKAFPWHFLTDRNLQITQLGGGFMKLFGRQLTQSGYFMGTYFEISKPIGVRISFKDILRRTNSSFVLTLRLPSSLNNSPVQVSHKVLR